jgi:DNA-binding GntR family transcriptional regulator
MTPRAGGEGELPLYERIRNDIVEGELTPGSRLVEATLASRYGASRTPVREALRELEHDGLVERRERGATVRQPTAEQIEEIYEVRCLLESAAVGVAAERHGEIDEVRLAALLEEMEALDPTDVPGRVRLNGEFHQALWRASQNQVMVEMLERLYANMKSLPLTTLDDDDRWRESIKEHRGLLEAVAARDPERASSLMSDHLRSGRDLRLRRAIARTG